MPVLDSPESRPLLDYAKNLESRLFWLMLRSPHTGLCWIILNSLEIRPLLDYAQQSTSSPLLGCSKKFGKQTFV